MSSTVMVSFRGDGAGVREMSWGQREIWAAMCRQEYWLPIGGIAPLPVPTPVDEIVAVLARAISRHHSLRTRLKFEPDGSVRQALFDHGEVALHVIDVPEDDDPDQVAADLEDRYRRNDFDFERDWPIRVGVLRRNGLVTHLVMLFNHFVLDGGGVAALFRDGFSALFVPDFVANDAALAALTPFAQVEWQRSPAGRRHDLAMQRHWRRLLARVPSRRFADTDDERNPRHWQVRVFSRAAYLAMRVISARTGCESSSVVLAGVAVGLAKVTGIDPAVVQVVANNRFRPGLADSVSVLSQTGLCVIETADTPFDVVCDRVRQSVMNAYLHAYYQPDAMRAMIADIGRERGAEIDLGCLFNDRRSEELRLPTGEVITPGDVTEALAETTLRWGPHSHTQWERFFFHVQDTPDTLEILFQADTRYLPPNDMRTFLHDFESTLVAAACDQALPAGRSESLHRV